MMAATAANSTLIQQQPRRQSARPTAPPPILSASSGHYPPATHVYASRQQFPPRPSDAHAGSDPSPQFSQHQPRHSVQPDHQLAHARPTGSSRRPLNPPSLNLPNEGSAPASAEASTPSSASGGRPPPTPPGPTPPTPPTSPPRQNRPPSSRRALVAALSLAQEAVRLDTAGNDPQAAADAYARSVLLLREVMSRVSAGESAQREPTGGNRRARNLTPREEEVRRLQSIHDTYAERLEVLSNLYNVALPEMQTPTVPTRTPISRRPSQELLTATSSNITRTSSRSPRPSLGSPSIEQSEAGPSNSFPHPSQTPSLGGHRTSLIPPQRPPPTGPPPPNPATPLTARPGSVTPQQQSQQLAPADNQPASTGRTGSHRRTPSSVSDRQAVGDDSDRTETVPRPSSSATWRPGESNAEQVLVASAIPSRISGSSSPTSPPPLPSPSTPKPTDQPPSKRGVSTSSQISSGTHDSSASSSATGAAYSHSVRSRGNTSSSVSSWSDAVPDSNSDKMSSRTVGSTNQGSIAQRRRVGSNPAGGSISSVPPPVPAVPGTASPIQNPLSARLNVDSLPPSTITSLGINPAGRHRAVSTPGRRPSIPNGGPMPGDPASDPSAAKPPPLPATATGKLMIPRKPSIPQSLGGHTSLRSQAQYPGINITVQTAGGTHALVTPSTSALNPSVSYFQSQQAAMQQQVPPSPPVDPLRRPFHLMGLLLASITSKQGGYLTRRLYVPHDVWSQGGAKLTLLSEKGKCVEILNAALEDVAIGSGDFFRGAGRGNAEKWLKVLDDWSGVCDGVLSGPGKKLGVGEGFSGRKSSGVTSWGGKFTKALDRITAAKGFDNPTVYTAGLTKLFVQAQMFDEHVKAFSNSFTPTPYSTLSPEVRQQVEARLKRSAEFFASVVLTWVIRDLGLLLDKYVKKGEKWLAE